MPFKFPNPLSFSYSAMLHHKDHITNAEVRNKITKAVGPHEDPLTSVKKRKLKCYGHITRFQRWIDIRWGPSGLKHVS